MSGHGYDGDDLTAAQCSVNEWRELADHLIGWQYPESISDDDMRKAIQKRWAEAECGECGSVGDRTETCGTMPEPVLEYQWQPWEQWGENEPPSDPPVGWRVSGCARGAWFPFAVVVFPDDGERGMFWRRLLVREVTP